MPTAPIVSPATLHDATLFASAALVFVLVSYLFPIERRRGLLAMAVIATIGVAALYGYSQIVDATGSRTVAILVRELILAVVAFSVIRVFMIFVLQTLLARLAVPRILSEFLLALLLIGYALFRLSAVGVNLAGVVTTSAVITGALAFSAQEMLGNLWAGISLQLENTLRLGDWIRVENVTGQVVGIRWRSMQIATTNNETIIIPNSQLMKDKVTVIGRHGEDRAPWRRSVSFQVDYDLPPVRVCAVVSDALQRAELTYVAREPKPVCVCDAFEDSGARYSAVYMLTDPRRDWATKSEVLTHVFAALARGDMPIPFPRQVVELRADPRAEADRIELAQKRALLDEVELFAPLTPAEKDSLARRLQFAPYVTDDVVCRQGEPADSLFILARGTVHVVSEASDGLTRHKFATLGAPAYFGEMGLLLGAPRGATVLASGEVVCYQLDKRAFDAVIQARPELAVSLSEALAKRQAANQATLQQLDAEQRARHAVSAAAEMVRKIRDFFGLAS
ncbi:MAG: mechanosensitive ion channel family protein [Burkholderiales bacterium]|nr:mechanosensitive ion channel family protein [Burkholderiales bacterium]